MRSSKRIIYQLNISSIYKLCCMRKHNFPGNLFSNQRTYKCSLRKIFSINQQSYSFQDKFFMLACQSHELLFIKIQHIKACNMKARKTLGFYVYTKEWRILFYLSQILKIGLAAYTTQIIKRTNTNQHHAKSKSKFLNTK